MTVQCSPSTAHGVVEEFDLRTRRPATGVAVLEVVGEVDGFTAPLVLEATRNELEAGARALVLDLAGVSFCSARCIETLVEVRRLAEGHGATVRCDRPSERVRRTADLVHARDVIDGPALPRPGQLNPPDELVGPRVRTAASVAGQDSREIARPACTSAGTNSC
jgi:anti-sigma B factor antagonist